MRSVSEGQSTRDRIVRVAVERFARSGFGVGLRVIAADAGVSAALLVHHFGSKAGLREACDTHVLDVVREAKTEAVTTQDLQPLMARMFNDDAYAPFLLYAFRTVQAGGPDAASFVDQFVEDAGTYLELGVAAGRILPSVDAAARARYLTYQGIGAVLVQLTVEGVDVETAEMSEVFRRLATAYALPALELYSQGLFTDRSVLDAYLAYAPDPPGENTSRAPSPPDPQRRETS